MNVVVCDLCGKRIAGFDHLKRFKIKEYKPDRYYGGWEKIDAHESCIEKLFEAKQINHQPPSGGSSQQED